MNIIDFFDSTQIINLASRADRRIETQSEFLSYGMSIPSDKVHFFNAIAPTVTEGFPSLGVRGCFLSHLKILEETHLSGLHNVLILEDDISFSKNIQEYGNIAIESLRQLDWDIVYFGHALDISTQEVAWKNVNQPMLLAHFYAINSRIIPSLVACLNAILERPAGHPDGGPMHYDGALNTFMQKNPQVKAYYFSKNLGYQRPSRTDLHELTLFDKYLFFQPFISTYRQLKRQYLKCIR